MTIGPRYDVIRRTLAELAAFEGEAAAQLELVQQISVAPAAARSAIRRFQPLVEEHRERLAAYLADCGGDVPGTATIRQLSASKQTTTLPEMLRDLCLAFHKCALGYAMAFEVALRLYEPRLREMAPRHLKTHADAALSTARVLPEVVAWQLEQDGMHCACICPMCGLGACGCVAYGTQTVAAAWRDTAPADAGLPGFVLQSPRPESQLAEAGVAGGDLVLSVDGKEVRTFEEVQTALRKHGLGDEVRLKIQRGTQAAREITVRHLSDYPNR